MVKEIAMLGGDTKDFMPECVRIELKKRVVDLSKDKFVK
jgi:pantetheine-phosphate adenylyltransferase